ncbi:MAG: 30S ribosomal protein S1 [Chitinophagales bacterium]|nr:30S ribosomal protein S1 [Chitinophagales bacterium]MDW8272644.1 30S ribosomal protein S1 [Chitinophagales bacterium]
MREYKLRSHIFMTDSLETTDYTPSDSATGGHETVAAETITETTESNEASQAATSAHDDFDWSIDKRNVVRYDEKQRAYYDELYSKTLKTIEDNEIVKGTVVAITPHEVILNIGGYKSDGMVPRSEFRDVEDLKIGDTFEVYVVSKEDSKGHLILSRKNAKMLKAWDYIVEAHRTGAIVTGKITSKTKGGLIVNINGMETFLPGSQIDVKPITDYDVYVGKTMELKVVKINEAIKNAVVSHKALIESDLEQQREEIISKLEKGQVLEGVVKAITDFGAFIDLGGLDGLLYITDISWGRIAHPSEVLQVQQKLNVVVLDFDDNKKRISLGLKQLLPHPWDTLDKDIEIGARVKGKVVNIEDYGAFLEIVPGVEGLVHVSEISWSATPINSRDFFKLGDVHEAIVMTLDREERKMSLSIKRLTDDPWQKVEEKYPVGSRHTGIVRNLTPYNVFVELDEYVGGYVHISDLSWLKRFNHPSEYTKVGNQLEVVVLEIDKENRKLILGHRQIEEDPWNTFEEVFPVGSVHEATVMQIDDKGAVVLLPYGLEGYAPKKHLAKEQGGLLGPDEKAEFKVLEFNRNEKKILVSHARVWEDKLKEQKEAEKNERKAEAKRTKKEIANLQQKVEKATLGDLGILSQIKEQMEGKESEKKSE